MKRSKKDHFFPAKKRIVAIGAAALIAATTIAPSYTGLFGTITAEAAENKYNPPTALDDGTITFSYSELAKSSESAKISGIEGTLGTQIDPVTGSLVKGDDEKTDATDNDIFITGYRIAKPTYNKDKYNKKYTELKGSTTGKTDQEIMEEAQKASFEKFSVDNTFLKDQDNTADIIGELKKTIGKAPGADLTRKLAATIKKNVATGVVSAEAEIPFEKSTTEKDSEGNYIYESEGNYIYESEDTTDPAGIPAGEYIVLIQSVNDAKYVYQPLFLACYYDENQNLVISYKNDDGTKDADKNSISTLSHYNGDSTAYAKREEIKITKSISASDEPTDKSGEYFKGSDDLDKADDLAVGQAGEFKIVTQIPDYSDAFNNITYNIVDDQADEFSNATISDVKVSASSTDFSTAETLTKNAADGYTVTNGKVTSTDDTKNSAVFQTGDKEDDNDFQISFKGGDDWLKRHAGQFVQITYKATLNKEPETELAAIPDTVHLNYTNSIYGETSWKKDNVNEYTFKLQIKKVDANDTSTGLSGAKFTLTRTDGGSNKVYESDVTDSTGFVKFSGLDEGTYTLKETSAPQGYSLNSNTYTVKIVPDYSNSSNTLNGYSVFLYSDKSKEYIEDYEIGGLSKITATNDTTFITIRDTKEGGLPSTGGRGTIVLTLIATIGAAGFLTLHLVNKKEQDA